jgi:hypothetical protein
VSVSSLAELGLLSGLEKAEEALACLTSEKFISDDFSLLTCERPKAKLTGGMPGSQAGPNTVSIPGCGSFFTAGPIHTGLSQTDDSETSYLFGLGLCPSAVHPIFSGLTEGAVLLPVQFEDVDNRNRADKIVSTQEDCPVSWDTARRFNQTTDHSRSI